MTRQFGAQLTNVNYDPTSVISKKNFFRTGLALTITENNFAWVVKRQVDEMPNHHISYKESKVF